MRCSEEDRWKTFQRVVLSGNNDFQGAHEMKNAVMNGLRRMATRLDKEVATRLADGGIFLGLMLVGAAVAAPFAAIPIAITGLAFIFGGTIGRFGASRLPLEPSLPSPAPPSAPPLKLPPSTLSSNAAKAGFNIQATPKTDVGMATGKALRRPAAQPQI
jgi:hypothetical protein